jgi:ribosome recycling factor
MPLTRFAKKRKILRSEDESHDLQEEVQKLTDKSIQQIDKLLEAKEKEIMTI